MTRRRFVLLVLCACSLYVGASFMALGFRHPEMTDTQLLLAWKDALLWR
jgi:hypothetical protein